MQYMTHSDHNVDDKLRFFLQRSNFSKIYVWYSFGVLHHNLTWLLLLQHQVKLKRVLLELELEVVQV